VKEFFKPYFTAKNLKRLPATSRGLVKLNWVQARFG